MPLFKLKCKNCGHIFEELVSLNSPYPPCPLCKGGTRQDFSGSTLVGTGKKSACSGKCSTCGGCKK